MAHTRLSVSYFRCVSTWMNVLESRSRFELILKRRPRFLPTTELPFPTPRRLMSTNGCEKNPGKDSTKILYDGDCKICQVEISLLKRYTKNKDNLAYVDISSLDYDPSQYGGVSYEEAMKEMHVIGQNGTVHTQGDAIRQMYRACGLGWVAAFTELPVIKSVCDRLYLIFAEYRLRKALERCDSGVCSIKLKHLRDKLEDSNHENKV